MLARSVHAKRWVRLLLSKPMRSSTWQQNRETRDDKGIIIKIIPLFGSVILFLAWVFQQTLLGNANSELQRIYSAQSVFQTYQSNNALFNAILETVKTARAQWNR